MISNKIIQDRKCYIGGSDIAVILGISKYHTPYQLYQLKTGEVTKEETSSPYAQFGNIMEKFIAEEYIKDNPKAIFYNDDWKHKNAKKPITFFHPEYPMFGGNIDGQDKDTLLEIKTNHRYEKIDEDHLPVEWLTQVNWYMFITGLRKCKILVFSSPKCTYEVCETYYDEELVEYITTEAHKFWELVTKETPPPQTSAKDYALSPVATPHSTIEANHDVVAKIRIYEKLNENYKSIADRMDVVKSQILEYMQDKEQLTISGEPAVKYANQSTTRFDISSFKKANPELYKQYAVTSSTRVCKFIKSKKERK